MISKPAFYPDKYPNGAHVFTPHVCYVIKGINQVIRALRATGAHPIKIKMEAARYGVPAVLIVRGGNPLKIKIGEYDTSLVLVESA